jgi:hypothetical protein
MNFRQALGSTEIIIDIFCGGQEKWSAAMRGSMDNGTLESGRGLAQDLQSIRDIVKQARAGKSL